MPWINATISGTAGAPADKVNGATLPNNARVAIYHNPSKTAYATYTLDGTTPVIGTNGITLFPGGTTTADVRKLNGPLSVIGEGSQSFTIYYEE